MSTDPTVLYAAATSILLAAETAIADAGLEAAGRSLVSFGRPTDDCCEDRILAVHLERTYPTESFPTDAGGTRLKCAYKTAAPFLVTFARCWPVGPSTGTGPTDDEVEAATADLYAYWWVLWCALLDAASTGELVPGLTCSLGAGGPGEHQLPSGACVRFTIRVTVQLTNTPLIS